MGIVRFHHLGHLWECEGSGWGVAVRSGSPKISADYYFAEFRCLSVPARKTYEGRISSIDPGNVAVDELRRALEEGIVIDALQQADCPLEVGEIAELTELPEARVREALAGMPDRVDWEYDYEDPSDDEPRYFLAGAALHEELDRRLQAYARDRDPGVSWEALRDRLGNDHV